MPGMNRSTVGAAVTAVVGLLLFAGSASADQLARTVARVDAPRAQLDRAQTNAVPGGGQIRHYQQKIAGLPVFGAEAVVVVPPGADSIIVSDTTSDRGSWSPTAPAISAGDAIAAARSATGAKRLRSKAQAKLGYTKSGALAWEVSLPSAKPLADFVVAVDARSGKKLSSKDVLKRATTTGSAMIFNPNPVVEQGGYSGLKDKNDKDYALLTSLRVPVTLENLVDSAKGCLKGTLVDARVGKQGKKVCSPGFDFTGVTRSDDDFEALMAYFHIDRERTYADSLGLSQPLRQKAQKVFADAIPDDNSFYSSQTQELVLGTGGVDDGEDADVISHEYGHSLQDQASPHSLQTREGGTIGEGFGDYMAAAMNDLSFPGSAFDTCIFDWDGISYSATGTCGRTADVTQNLTTAERKCQKEIHCVGQVVSSTLFELRQALGNDVNGQSIMDRVTLEANFSNSKGTTFKSFAKGLLAADQLLYAGAHIPTIEADLVSRKFCKSSGC
jgi:Fungalysin metallopeptidase (M36)